MRRSFLLIVLLFIFWPSTAHAYLDPGSGSLILQVLIGGIAAGLLAVKTYWLKIKAFFCGKRGAPGDENSTK